MAEHLTPLTGEELEGLDTLDLDTLASDALETLLLRIRLTYPVLAAQEPEDSESEGYLLWQEDLEMLDDYIDELTERLATA